MAIDETSLTDFGLGSGDGFVYLKDEFPVCQLHAFEDSRLNTIFWRGGIDLNELQKNYVALLREISSIINIPFEPLRYCSAYYGSADIMHESVWVIDPATDAERDVEEERLAFLKHNLHSVTFARFDTDPAVIDVSLWADLVRGADAEIGFSSVVAPDTVFRLLERTSVRPLSDRDLDALTELIQSHMYIKPAYA